MKVWISAMIGLALFIGLGIYVQIRLEKTSLNFTKETKELDTVLKDQQWQPALKKLTQFENKWKKTKPFWAMLIIHREMDSIDEALIRTKKAIQSKNASEAQMELGSLEHYIQHIPERERFSLVNIF
jgi:hypothetical protein